MKFPKQIWHSVGIFCLLLAAAGIPTQAAEFAVGADKSFYGRPKNAGRFFTMERMWKPATGSHSARGFFDENGNSLPGLNVFDKYALPLPRKASQ